MFGNAGKAFAGQIASHVESAVSQCLAAKTPQSTERATESLGKVHGTRKALFVGINYYGQQGELRGCINDVKNIKSYLTSNYRIDEVMVLTDDTKDPNCRPTRQNILNAFRWLRKGAQAGDSLIFHYSGHGGSVKDTDGDEEDGMDETLCPVDYASAGQIVDDEVHDVLVRGLPKGVRLTAIMDCCHSESILDLPYVYTIDGDLQIIENNKNEGIATIVGAGTRFLLDGNKKRAVSSITSGMKLLMSGGKKGDSAAREKTEKTRSTEADVIQFSGCKDSQTSADAQIGGQATGAMSFALISCLKKDKDQDYTHLKRPMLCARRRRPTAVVLAALLLSPSAALAADASSNGDTSSGRADNVAKTTFRVFQTLPSDPASMSPDQLAEVHRALRSTQAMVFAPSLKHQSSTDGKTKSLPDDGVELALDVYAPQERREYLVRRGSHCHPRGDGSSGSGVGGGALDPNDEGTSLQWYDVLSRYDALMASAAAAREGKFLNTDNASTQISRKLSSKDALHPKKKKGSFEKRYKSHAVGEDSSHSSKDSADKGQSDPDPYTSDASATANAASRAAELERAAVELFKFCMLYNGDGHAYLGWGEQLLAPLRDAVGFDGNYGIVAEDSVGKAIVDANAIVEGDDDSSNASAFVGGSGRYIHESFLSVSPHLPPPSELSSVIRLLLETPDDVLANSPLLLPRELHRLIVGKKDSAKDDGGLSDVDGSNKGVEGKAEYGSSSWTLLENSCVPMAPVSSGTSAEVSTESLGFLADQSAAVSGFGSPDVYSRRMAAHCPLSAGGYCCLAFGRDGDSLPVMALHHPVGGYSSDAGASEAEDLHMPYKLHADATVTGKAPSKPLKLGLVPESDLRYVSTVRLVQNNTKYEPDVPAGGFPNHPADSPNFFDILFENDCLPYRKECHRCLKTVSNEAPIPGIEGEEGSEFVGIADYIAGAACSRCHLECPCYCDALCKIRPPPKQVTRTYAVRPPVERKHPGRLVPKIVHQTWFEPVTKEGYPNMSRLIESWKRSGWEYVFYDDDSAGEFLGAHFPPEVREAYESITPGAFKADLFRYCVLLIRGGVYADMDVLLQTNLDDAVASDVGFMTPIDEPGIKVGHRSCLWNGLIASAPGHPFLARTIEIVVNNIRNRYTSVDYDNMLCPSPILSVSHTVDTLFTCGPCILGAGINDLMGRHMQTEFDLGEIDIWQSEKESSDEGSQVSPDDPRHLVPGRTVILEQNKNDMGAHRFTWADRHLIIAATDMPDYDDRPPTKEHYSKTKEQSGIYGLRKLYTNTKRANEEIRIVVEKL
ncbi:hypothetical protein ACHAXT_006162 [Thalassiosira profunda]